MLTNSFQIFKQGKKQQIKTLTVNDFVGTYCSAYPDLIDFLSADTSNIGGDEIEMEVEEDPTKPQVFAKHLCLSDIQIGMTKG